MNRVAVGAVCIAACLLSLIEAKRARRALGAIALEQMEHLFDVMENVLHLA
jgi:hypothetical protein